MPVIADNSFPAIRQLLSEGLVIQEKAKSVPLHIGVLNLMPLKEETEADLIRIFNSSEHDIIFQWFVPKNHICKNTSKEHIERYYGNLTKEEQRNLDAIIITGAPLEKIPFHHVDYWEEFCQIIDNILESGMPVLLLCWAAYAVMHYKFNIPLRLLDRKLSGVYRQNILRPEHSLMTGIGEVIYVPVSRFITADMDGKGMLEVLAENQITGPHVALYKNMTFVTGHGEYPVDRLLGEYNRDLTKGLNPDFPVNYVNTGGKPIDSWSDSAKILFNNWINFTVFRQDRT